MDDLISRQTDCVLKEFGDCSYSETGCADCEVKENIRNALSAQWKCKRMYTDVSDTISRKAAIDAVCMEWCGVKHQDCKHPFDVEKDDYYWCDGCETVFRTLPDLPSVQPEIVRCKDCKYYVKDHGWNRIEYMVCGISTLYKVLRNPDDYCSRAERRTDG